MKGKTAYILAAALAAALAASCSVKEDRTSCPSYLTVFYHEAAPVLAANGITSGVVTTVTNGSGFRYRLSVDPSEYPGGLEVPVVPKGAATVSGLSGVSLGEVSQDRYTVRRGEEADRIWADSQVVDCTGELAADTVRLHKQYAVMRITFRGSEAYAAPSLRVRGGCNAMDTNTLEALRGEFYASARHTGGTAFEVRVPRQAGTDLYLDVIDGAETVSTVEVGEKLASAGYNWAKRDLDDIEVLVDYAVSDATVTVAPWRDGGYTEHVI